jgi:hypothetical protein
MDEMRGASTRQKVLLIAMHNRIARQRSATPSVTRGSASAWKTGSHLFAKML